MDHTICLHIKYFMHFIFCNIKMTVKWDKGETCNILI